MYVVAVLFNYPWERVQSSLYVGMYGANAASWLCLLASLIDGLLVLVIFLLGASYFVGEIGLRTLALVDMS